MKKLALVLGLAATGLLPATRPASGAESGTPQDPFVITFAPYTITQPGYYRLGSNLNSTRTSGNIITVLASNVTLDFNGFYISGPVGNTSQTTVGVGASEKSNLTIKNGTIAYCATGIYLTGNNTASTNAVDEIIDNMRVTYCYHIGVYLDGCVASTVANCKVSQTGYPGADLAWGILCVGGGCVVQNNVVSNVTSSAGFAAGVGTSGGFARQNSVLQADYGVYGGIYQDNLTLHCTVPYDGGTDAGGNK